MLRAARLAYAQAPNMSVYSVQCIYMARERFVSDVYVLVITWRGGMLLVYSARHPRARSARPQHTDAPCYN